MLLEPAETSLPVLATHDELVASESEDGFDWPEFDEWTASALCYTSGTTGRPKGVLYTHRSTLLHAYAVSLPDGIPASSRDAICPVVPMFHACGWSVPYYAPMNGVKLVLPGPYLDGASLYELFEAEGVTLSLGVPSVWFGFEAHLNATGARCSTFRRILSGGSAVPPSMITAFERHGIEVTPGLGHDRDEPGRHGGGAEGQARRARSRRRSSRSAPKQGRPLFGVEMKIVDDAGRELPHDGKSVGELLVRGPWIVGAYYEDDGGDRGLGRAGRLVPYRRRRDDRPGRVSATDRPAARTSSNRAANGSARSTSKTPRWRTTTVGEAAAIAMPHPKWGERPLTDRDAAPGSAGRAQARARRADRVSRRAIPALDAARRRAGRRELPHTATGKIMKTRLRELYARQARQAAQ